MDGLSEKLQGEPDLSEAATIVQAGFLKKSKFALDGLLK